MYFITISEMIGTNGERIARKVAEELKYTLYGTEELLKAASEMGFLSEIKKLDEKAPAMPYFLAGEASFCFNLLIALFISL
jgi:cytidylate kinase